MRDLQQIVPVKSEVLKKLIAKLARYAVQDTKKTIYRFLNIPESVETERDYEEELLSIVLDHESIVYPADLYITKKFRYIDNYKHLKFKSVKTTKELQLGTMIQVLENNTIPASWEWIEVTYKLLAKLIENKESLKWVRVLIKNKDL